MEQPGTEEAGRQEEKPREEETCINDSLEGELLWKKT